MLFSIKIVGFSNMRKINFPHHIDTSLKKRSYDITILSVGKQQKTLNFHNLYVKTNYVFEYVVEGKGQVKIGDRIYPVQKGDLILFPPDTLLETWSDNEHPLAYWWVDFNGSTVSYLLENIGFDDTKHVIFYDQEKIETLLSKIYKITQTNSLITVLSAISYLFELFALLISLNKNSPQNTNLMSTYVEKAVCYIESYYMQNITVADIANHVHLSRYYMTDIFKQQTNMSPIEYLIEYRIKQAKHMLVASKLSITEIALNCGFNSPSNFAMQFKQLTNLTPTEYRKTNQ